jgi:hypothetical protein
MDFHGNVSPWIDADEVPRSQKLGENLRADICVIGAGIAGLTG